MRIGIGYDVHALKENKKLVIGGVHIPCEKGLEGHSDADVLIHAVMDSLLGAMSCDDIGTLFPDTDERYSCVDSRLLLRKVAALVEEKGYRVCNIDSIIIAQRPKMRPYIEQMVKNIAEDLNVEKDRINIKSTTTEHLGFEGREEGMCAQAVCLLENQEKQ